MIIHLFAIIAFSVIVWCTFGFYNPLVIIAVSIWLAWLVRSVFFTNKNDSSEKLKFFALTFTLLSSILSILRLGIWNLDEHNIQIIDYVKFMPLMALIVDFFIWNKDQLSLKFGKPALPVSFLFLCYYLALTIISPEPFIDVYLSNQKAAQYLLNLQNPYSQIYPDIYKGLLGYQPGFLYWPGTLYLQTISEFLTGDVRIVNILAWWICPYFFPATANVRHKLYLVWWSLPFLSFGLENAWVDPLLSASTAIMLWAYTNRRYFFLALAIGLAAATKQYGFIIGFFFMAWWLLGLVSSKTTDKAAFFKVTFMSMTFFILLLSPFLLWSYSDFIAMTLSSHGNAVTRPDALNFTALWINLSGRTFPASAQSLMTLSGFITALYFLLINCKNKFTLSQVPLACSIAFGFAFMFGKFGFCNYYWLLISFWLLNLAYVSDEASQV